MNDHEAAISLHVTSHYLAKINHWIEVLGYVVIRPIFEMQMYYISLLVLLKNINYFIYLNSIAILLPPIKLTFCRTKVLWVYVL